MEITWLCSIKQLFFRDHPEINTVCQKGSGHNHRGQKKGRLQPPGLASPPAVKAFLCIYYFSVTITVMVSTETESAQRRKDRFHLTLFVQAVSSQQHREEVVTYSPSFVSLYYSPGEAMGTGILWASPKQDLPKDFLWACASEGRQSSKLKRWSNANYL